ncbi:MAG: hypothetical protein D9C04_00650 [Nitrosopumilus sp. B06]|nr:MAG: hypothetical protein D9C04_00650 [Nitrosopumilus sp. B06]
MHPRVPTNNESERALRQMVIYRKIRQRIATSGGMGGVWHTDDMLYDLAETGVGCDRQAVRDAESDLTSYKF